MKIKIDKSQTKRKISVTCIMKKAQYLLNQEEKTNSPIENEQQCKQIFHARKPNV